MLRRQAARLATVGALLGGLVAVGASPAFADDDSVRVRSAGSFTAGGSPGGVSVEVRKRSDGCVLLRTALGLRLDGLSAEQVKVQVNYSGRWWPVPVGGGGGQVGTTQTSPSNPTLCKGKSVTIRYRLAFVAGTPGGRLEVAGEATSAAGRVLGRGADTSRVVGGRATASPSPSKKPSPRPSAVATEPVTAAETASALAAGLDPASGQSNAAEESSGGSMIMFFGIAMVLVGAALIALLVRNSRKDKPPADDYSPFPGAPLPRNPGGTTYRSGGGAPGAPLPPPGQVYGQQPPAARPTGGVYGGTPAPRPSGGTYGGSPTPPPHQPGTPPPPPGGQPPGGDATTIMPRLPG